MRDFFLIAHGCNDVRSVAKALHQGANAIEADFTYTDSKWVVSHDGTKQTELNKWLNAFRKLRNYDLERLSVILFDIKSPRSIRDLRILVNDIIPHDIPKIYCTAKISDAHILAEVVTDLGENEGISIDEENDPEAVNKFYQSVGAANCWYGNGITLVPVNDSIHESMKKALSMKGISMFSRIYTWTVSRKKEMKKYILEDKVDGILVNLNGFLSRPVTKALHILKRNRIPLAGRDAVFRKAHM